MDIRPFRTEDYSLFSTWWEEHEFPVPPIEVLPESAGLVVEGPSGPICAGWLYSVYDTPMSWLEFIVGDPRASKDIRDAGLDALVESAMVKAKREGHVLIFTSVEHPALIERYKKHGFEVTDTRMTNFVRAV